MLHQKRYIVPFVILMFPVVLIFALIRHAISFLFRALKPKNYPPVLRTPPESFACLSDLGYNFTANYVELSGGNLHLPRVHYVDEGPQNSEHVILCIHGEPTWSFLYRFMIKELSHRGYRVIALDFIGFGKSDKYSSVDMYTHDLHTLTLKLFIEHLKLSNITLVVHDWGGPVGLSVVKDMPQLIDSLCILNTVLPCRDDTALRHIVNLFHFICWSAAIFVCQTHIPLGALLGYEGVDGVTSKGYTAPFPNYRYKAGVARWPQLVPMLPWGNSRIIEDMRNTKRFLRTWKKPVLMMFCTDGISGKGPSKELFKSLFPHGVDIPITGGGCLSPEFKGEELAQHLCRFLNENKKKK
eukprot:sb/3466139/